VRAVDGLRLDGRIPPRVVEHHVAGVGEVQARAGRARASEQEHAGARCRPGRR
jgi:hypothetical protein